MKDLFNFYFQIANFFFSVNCAIFIHCEKPLPLFIIVLSTVIDFTSSFIICVQCFFVSRISCEVYNFAALSTVVVNSNFNCPDFVSHFLSKGFLHFYFTALNKL